MSVLANAVTLTLCAPDYLHPSPIAEAHAAVPKHVEGHYADPRGYHEDSEER